MVASFHETQSKRKNKRGLIIYGCYNGRLRGAQGALSALRGAFCTSAPKIGAHSGPVLTTSSQRARTRVNQ